LKKKSAIIAIVLVFLVSVALFLSVNWFSDNGNATPKEFYVGVEYALPDYNITEIYLLADKVANYTNLFVLGSVELTLNQSDLNLACDYIVSKDLKLVVFFTNSDIYNYNIFIWMIQAQQKYGDLFYAVYRYDEPGGGQLSGVSDRLVNSTDNYANAAGNFTNGLGVIVNYFEKYAPRLVNADFGLYWFDYKANYTSVFAEFVGNQSRQLHIALCRGAAQEFNRYFGVIVTWKYNQAPYIESGNDLYNDLVLAYNAGAKYAVVFSYPRLGPYGILTQQHFDAIQNFWKYANSHWGSYGSSKAEVAYVVPKDYGFGFRSADDTIWGLFNADSLSPKIWSDTVKLESLYGNRFNIIYDDNLNYTKINKVYDKVIFWNQTVK
jgi:hypothetical protein